MTKKLLLGILSLYGVSTFAQDAPKEGKPAVEPATYKMAIGGKYYPQALSFKLFLAKSNAIEVNAYLYRHSTMRLTAMYQHYMKIKPLPAFRWYFGGGLHVSYASNNGAHIANQAIGLGVGVDGCIGVDYKFPKLPVNISFDWQPSLNLVNGFIWDEGYGGIGIRYVLK